MIQRAGLKEHRSARPTVLMDLKKPTAGRIISMETEPSSPCEVQENTDDDDRNEHQTLATRGALERVPNYSSRDRIIDDEGPWNALRCQEPENRVQRH